MDLQFGEIMYFYHKYYFEEKENELFKTKELSKTNFYQLLEKKKNYITALDFIIRGIKHNNWWNNIYNAKINENTFWNMILKVIQTYNISEYINEEYPKIENINRTSEERKEYEEFVQEITDKVNSIIKNQKEKGKFISLLVNSYKDYIKVESALKSANYKN